MPEQYLPVLLTLGVAILLGVTILVLSQLLGQQTGGRVKGTTIESGMPLLDVSHKRISIAFFLVAIDFIVFDLEAAFLFPWAVSLREIGLAGWGSMMLFLVELILGFVYAWKKGALEWE